MAEPNRILNSAETYIDSGLRGIPKQPKSQTAENEKLVSNSRIFVYAAI